MKIGLRAAVVLAGAALGAAGETPVQERGAAKADPKRPDHFPHRIWAACDFEAQLPDYAWFGPAEKSNIPKYPGNATACRHDPKEKAEGWGAMTGCNPVPGPCMGKVNKLYCRYFIKGATQAHFQYFSLSVEDNNHIDVSELTEGKWSEVVMNFTENGQRNDGTQGVPFQPGERMDDLKVWIGTPETAGKCEIILDDIIFYDDDPSAPKETEPFPNRVMFVEAFDTGTDEESRKKYFPGEWELVYEQPAGAYWGAARAVTHGQGRWVRLKMEPERTAGAATQARFRYYVTGATSMKVTLTDGTDKASRQVELQELKENAWTFAYADFTKDGKGSASLAAGHKMSEISFETDSKDVTLIIDEVTVFEPGTQ